MLNGPRTRPNTSITWSNTCWFSAAKSDLAAIGGMRGMSVQRCVGLSPFVLISDIGQLAAADGAEVTHRIADGQDRVGMHAFGQTHRRFGFLFVQQGPCGQ